MNKKLFLGLISICIITHVIRSIYEILKHKKMLKASKITFVIVFTNMTLLWVSWFLLCTNDIHKFEPAGIVKIIGISAFGMGLAIFLIALFTIKSLESYEGDLITKGIYSKIRHPMYLGFILWLIGFPLIFGAFTSLILSLIFIVNILFWRYLEEKELKERFPSYNDYKKKTIF
jgi:protein-S-isoprenylcysteine O-methyltransferase Ste14